MANDTNINDISRGVNSLLLQAQGFGYLFTEWKQGTWYRDHSFDTSISNRVSFAYTIPVTAGNVIQVKCGSGERFARAAWTVNGGVYTNVLFGGWQTNDYRWSITENSEISIVVSKSDDGNITPEEVTTTVTIFQSDDC